MLLFFDNLTFPYSVSRRGFPHLTCCISSESIHGLFPPYFEEFSLNPPPPTHFLDLCGVGSLYPAHLMTLVHVSTFCSTICGDSRAVARLPLPGPCALSHGGCSPVQSSDCSSCPPVDNFWSRGGLPEFPSGSASAHLQVTSSPCHQLLIFKMRCYSYCQLRESRRE